MLDLLLFSLYVYLFSVLVLLFWRYFVMLPYDDGSWLCIWFPVINTLVVLSLLLLILLDIIDKIRLWLWKRIRKG